jgi:phage recombination protein Bet
VLFQDSPDSSIMLSMTPYTPSPLTSDQDSLLRRTITKHLTDDEHALFVQTCERSGLDPFARHIYPINREQWNQNTKRKERRYSAEATIDGLRLTAERTQRYGGQLGPEWCGKDGIWKDIWTADEPPCGARVGIIRHDFDQPVWGKALYSEFVQTYSNGEPTKFWVKMAANQLAKCAEALGFRKAFPREFSGIYTCDEMQQAEVIEISSSDRRPSPPKADADSDHVGVPLGLVRPVPLPLQVFVNGGMDRRNVTAAFEFIRRELVHSAGEAGQVTFDRIRGLLPPTFRTKEECRAATVQCWLDLWEAVEVVRESMKEAA